MNVADGAYQIWDDGFSPIVFVSITASNVRDIRALTDACVKLAKSIKRKHGKVFVILNFSQIDFTHENIELIKSIKKHLTKTFINALAIVSLRNKKFEINLCEDVPEDLLIKSFDCFETALSFINEQMEISQNEYEKVY